jgi:hypothetical protein
MCSIVSGDRKERSWEKPASRANGRDESEGNMFGVVREQDQEIDESKKRGYREDRSDFRDLTWLAQYSADW